MVVTVVVVVATSNLAIGVVVGTVLAMVLYAGDPANVVIDLSRSHIWDASTVATLDASRAKCAARGKTLTVVGLNEASQERHDRLAGQH